MKGIFIVSKGFMILNCYICNFIVNKYVWAQICLFSMPWFIQERMYISYTTELAA